MKSLLYITLLVGLGTACSASGGNRSVADRPTSANVITEKQSNKEEYELHILDNGFRSWFATYGRPVQDRSPEYYASQNRQYVSEWNQLANMQGGSLNSPFENRIDYDFNIDYGVQLNHELYWYFRYIESQYGRQYNFGNGRYAR